MISMICCVILMAVVTIIAKLIGVSDETILLYNVILLAGGMAGIREVAE